MTRSKYSTMPDPDDYQAMADYYRHEAASDYRQSAKRQRDAKRYRAWAREQLWSARIMHRRGQHEDEASYLANARSLARLARQADRLAPKAREYGRADTARARQYARLAADRQARVDAYLATPEGQQFASSLRGG